MILQKSTFTIFEMAIETFWVEEVFKYKGNQNMGARNFVRQAFLDKKPQIY